MQRRALVLFAVASGVASCESAPKSKTVEIPAQPTVAPTPASSAPPPPAPPSPPKIVEGPPPPPKQPIDPKVKVDGIGLLRGASPTEIWLLVGDAYSVVVDRATGCAVEGYRDPPAFNVLSASRDDETTEAELAKPETLAAIRDMVGLGRRFDVRHLEIGLDLAWSPDGRHIFVISNEHLYHSPDGGRSFALVDDFLSARMEMSRDGKHLVYERCQRQDCPSCRRQYGAGCNSGREYVSLPTDRSRGPKPFTGGQTHLLDMTADGRAMFWRSDSQICLDVFDLARPIRASFLCVPLPSKASGPWPAHRWESVSPSGKWGIVKWNEGRPNRVGAIALTYVVSLVDMQSGQIVKELTDVGGAVDDDGNIVAQSMTEGGGDHTYFYPRSGPRRLLGNQSLLVWREKEAVMRVYRVAPLGARRCDLIKSAKTP
ncbi:MAG: hypothetical protein KF819_34705 [Labilithrix sp.]|nr:hypothetical protein [Labilithrix sp.]